MQTPADRSCYRASRCSSRLTDSHSNRSVFSVPICPALPRLTLPCCCAQQVSNWEEYRDRAHGRDAFSLTVVLPYAQAHHYDGIDTTAFALEYCPLDLDPGSIDTAAAAATADVAGAGTTTAGSGGGGAGGAPPVAQQHGGLARLPPASAAADASAASAAGGALGSASDSSSASSTEHWCVHRDCTDVVTPFSSYEALVLHMHEAHHGLPDGRSTTGGRPMVAEEEEEEEEEAAGITGRTGGGGEAKADTLQWSAVRCGAPSIAASTVRVSSSGSGGGGGGGGSGSGRRGRSRDY
jgi:hypothetical protein